MGIEISKRLIFINSTSAVLSRLLNLTVVFWLFQYLIRMLDDEEFSLYCVVTAAILFVPLIIIVVSGGLERFVAEAYAKGDDRRITQICSTMAPIFAGIGLLVLVVGSTVAWNIEHLLTIESPRLVGDARWMFFTMVLMTVIRISPMPFLVGLQVKQKYIWLHIIDLIGQVLWMATLFALLFGVSTRAMWVPMATIPQTIFTITMHLILSRRQMPALRFKPSEIRRELIWPMVHFGGWTMIARVASVTRVAFGTLILHESPDSRPKPMRDIEVGAFKNGQLVDTRLIPLALVPLSTTLPILTAMQATGQTERLRRTYFRFCRYVLWAFLFAAVPLSVFSEEAWRLYLQEEYEKYSAVAVVMVLLLARSVVTFPQPVLAQLVAALDKTKPAAIRNVTIEVTAVLAVLFSVVVLESGAIGVATALACVGWVGHPLLVWTLGLKLTGGTWGSWWRQTLWPGMLPAMVAMPACLGIRAVLVPDTWFELVAAGAVSSVVYLATLLLFCLQPSERKDVAGMLARARAILPFGR